MLKQLLSILFGVIFMAFLSAPTIISVIDNSIDVSVFYTSTEEEDKGFEKDTIDFIFLENTLRETDVLSKASEDNLRYYFKKYPKPHLNLISPPPELIL